MLNTEFSPWPCYSEDEVAAVSRVLRSNRVNYWTGDETRCFENEFAAWAGAEHAVALMNGTVALEAALLALGINSGEVIVTSRSFFASASCIVSVGATPVFVDVDKDSQNISVETIRAAITPQTKAIICVHLAGWPCEMLPIMSLANEHNLFVIEDCAQAHGATYHKRPVGSWGHIAAWSFCQDKIMTTGGEGGMITTNDYNLWKRVWSHKDHGKSWDAMNTPHRAHHYRWLHDSFGTNWRMTEMQAVLGRIQLQCMPDWHASRLKNAQQLWHFAAKLPGLRVPSIPKYIEHAAYKCYLFVEPAHLADGWDRYRLISAINAGGVPCYSGSCSEIYLEKAFVDSEYQPKQPLPVARELGETSLVFLVHPTLSAFEMNKTCEVLKNVMHEATQQVSLCMDSFA